MNKATYLTALTASLLLVGCGSDDKNESSSGIEGTWQPKEFCERDGNESSTTSLILSSGKVTVLATEYTDSSCKDKLLLARTSGNYFLQQEVTLADGEKAQRFMIKVNKLEIAAPSETYASNANNRNLCGHNDWKQNQYKDVTDCEALDFEPIDDRDIFRVENNTLKFGDDDSPKSDGYPTKLEQGEGLVRR